MEEEKRKRGERERENQKGNGGRRIKKKIEKRGRKRE